MTIEDEEAALLLIAQNWAQQHPRMDVQLTVHEDGKTLVVTLWMPVFDINFGHTFFVNSADDAPPLVDQLDYAVLVMKHMIVDEYTEQGIFPHRLEDVGVDPNASV